MGRPSAAKPFFLNIEARLHERVREISVDLPVDERLIAQEIVRTAALSDISEEVTRFRAHLSHWHALADSDEPAAGSWISCCRR